MERNRKLIQDLPGHSRQFATVVNKERCLEKLIRAEKNTILPARYFFLIVDHESDDLLYVSPEVKTIYGISRNKIRKGHEHIFFDVVLEDEKRAVMDFFKSVLEIYYPRGSTYLSGRVFIAEYHVNTQSGNILHIMHQSEVLSYTEQGLPAIALSRFIDISWLFGVENERYVKQYIYNWKTNGIEHYSEQKISVNPGPGLTLRETEIQKLINRGLTSPEIAERLDISIETVKTHRKNINAKRSLSRA